MRPFGRRIIIVMCSHFCRKCAARCPSDGLARVEHQGSALLWGSMRQPEATHCCRPLSVAARPGNRRDPAAKPGTVALCARNSGGHSATGFEGCGHRRMDFVEATARTGCDSSKVDAGSNGGWTAKVLPSIMNAIHATGAFAAMNAMKAMDATGAMNAMNATGARRGGCVAI